MKHGILLIAITLLAARVAAHELSVVTDPNPLQDDWILEGLVHELGIGFPEGQELSATVVPWQGHVPCENEYAGTGAVQVRITNLSGFDWPEVYYVCDDMSSCTNLDEMVGNTLADIAPAFKIDDYGENTPLVSENVNNDGIFQNGESWEFVIQDYLNAWSGSAANLNSQGIVSVSSGPSSTGSILVRVPEPAALGLLALMIGATLRRRY